MGIPIGSPTQMEFLIMAYIGTSVVVDDWQRKDIRLSFICGTKDVL
jgi:hypothetical protein